MGVFVQITTARACGVQRATDQVPPCVWDLASTRCWQGHVPMRTGNSSLRGAAPAPYCTRGTTESPRVRTALMSLASSWAFDTVGNASHGSCLRPSRTLCNARALCVCVYVGARARACMCVCACVCVRVWMCVCGGGRACLHLVCVCLCMCVPKHVCVGEIQFVH